MIYFNPRLREGGDMSEEDAKAMVEISIHASAREATSHIQYDSDMMAFQSTPPRGRRPQKTRSSIIWRTFQSTPPRGRRLGFEAITNFLYNFNPRLREGGDDKNLYDADNAGISIHASAREATRHSD